MIALWAVAQDRSGTARGLAPPTARRSAAPAGLIASSFAGNAKRIVQRSGGGVGAVCRKSSSPASTRWSPAGSATKSLLECVGELKLR